MSQKDSQRIPPHNHCRVCGISVPPKREFCSDTCKEQVAQADKKRNKKFKTMVAVYLVVMALVILLALFIRFH